MKILFSTIALDAQPFISLIYAELRKLPKEIDWEWFVMEGTAAPKHCTRWVKEVEPRLSKDGTNEFLNSLHGFDERIRHFTCPQWDGKIEMVNNPLIDPSVDQGKEEFLLWQMDADELFSAEQILKCIQMFTYYPEKNAAYFWCNYFVGSDKVIVTRDGKSFGNYSSYEWHRVWRIKPGMLFKTHEPPVIDGLKLNAFTHAETEARGLVFDHYSFATRAQVEFKSKFYAGANNPNAKHYAGLVERWEKFQSETEWPRPLSELFPFVEKHVIVDRI